MESSISCLLCSVIISFAYVGGGRRGKDGRGGGMEGEGKGGWRGKERGDGEGEGKGGGDKSLQVFSSSSLLSFYM